MDERGAVPDGGPRERADGKGVRVQRLDRVCLGAVHVVVADAVDDGVRREAGHRGGDGAIVGHVERRAVERHDLVARRAFMDDGGAELAPRAGDDDAHQAALSAANARIFSSSSTPSQRATTAVAMQLPITFTAVRPMSMI